MRKVKGRIVKDGCGGFLNPPTHPEHSLHVENVFKKDGEFFMSLSGAVDADWLDEETRGRAKALLDGWQAPDLSEPEIQAWIFQTLGYFKNCYRNSDAGEKQWHVSDLLMRNWDPLQHVDDHAGVNLIRRYYPTFNPTREHFDRAYWGNPERVRDAAENVRDFAAKCHSEGKFPGVTLDDLFAHGVYSERENTIALTIKAVAYVYKVHAD